MDTQIKRIHKTLVVTSTNHALYEAYAHRFWQTFPHTLLDLKVYSEDTGFEFKTTFLHTQRDFAERNKHRPVSSYKWDAVRFCYKVYTIAQALEDYAYDDYDRLLWIDSDTQFHKQIDEDWITEHLYDPQALMTHAGRPNYYSECGLLLFNLEHPQCHNYIRSVRNLYDTDNIFLLKEWHDSYIWDVVREQYQAKGTQFKNIGVEHKVPGGHILAYLYGEWFDHMKGKRKQQGYSQELKRVNKH